MVPYHYQGSQILLHLGFVVERSSVKFLSTSLSVRELDGRDHYVYPKIFPGCNRTYEGEYGRILSPRYPYRMRGATNCSFSISVAQGRTVSLYFATFGLQGSLNCSRGSLKVINLMQLKLMGISNMFCFADLRRHDAGRAAVGKPLRVLHSVFRLLQRKLALFQTAGE